MRVIEAVDEPHESAALEIRAPGAARLPIAWDLVNRRPGWSAPTTRVVVEFS